MQVSATRRALNLTVTAVTLGFVFVLVLVLQGAVMGALRNAGMSGGPALLASGAIVFAVVVGGFGLWNAWLAIDRARAEDERDRLQLPEGPCCVVWRGGDEAEMPWALTTPIHAHFPPLARRFGIEGVAIAEFDISPEGRVKNIHCVDVWPSPIFYAAAKDALKDARFAVREGAQPRFGPSYRMPFVFRIQGSARVTDRGRIARRRRRVKPS
ncbi:MAG: TonB family protein [Hyphomonadaceae bacterium]|nr:TonB family protein [Hyphomonadaceae bacterium]